jgi:hypothetical protein
MMYFTLYLTQCGPLRGVRIWFRAEPSSPCDASAPSDPTDASSTIHPVQKRTPPVFHVAIHKLTWLRVLAVADKDTCELRVRFLHCPIMTSIVVAISYLLMELYTRPAATGKKTFRWQTTIIDPPIIGAWAAS